MKKGTYFGFGCLTSIILVLLVLGFSVYGLTKLSTKDFVAIDNNTLLSVTIQGPVAEYSRFSNDKFFNTQDTVFDIIQAIKNAKNDSRVNGLLLKPELAMLGYASLNEVVEAIEDFKTSGKPVVAYLTMASNADMLLASTADEITISASSSAGIFLKGFGVNMAYYKNMFDKIGVKMHIISAGKYKDYGTQYSHDYMSEETKENLNRILKSRFELFVTQLSNNLNVSTIVVESIINNEKYMFLEPDETIMTGLIQNKAFETDFLNEKEEKYGKIIDYKKYLMGFKTEKNKKVNDKIAVLYLNGSIMPVGSDFTVLASEWIEDAVEGILKDKSIKACVLRVNSPGGSALESEEILQTLKKLKMKMPVVVSMGDVAASGGYMISMASSKIFADPYSVTGSIGVVQMVPDAKNLQEKFGINHEKLEYGKKSTWLNTLNGVSDEQLVALKGSADTVYESFKKIVKTGRDEKFADLTDVEKVAQGQIWDAVSAKENGLIDEIGSLKDAVTDAARLANVQYYTKKNFPVRKNFFEFMLSEQLGVDEIKSMILKQTSETVYQQKLLMENFEQHHIQTILPLEFEN